MGLAVYTVEIVAELAARRTPDPGSLGYDQVRVPAGDGSRGRWPEAAPFDGIIVTAAAPRLPEPLLAQLRPGGRLVIPVGATRCTPTPRVYLKGAVRRGQGPPPTAGALRPGDRQTGALGPLAYQPALELLDYP